MVCKNKKCRAELPDDAKYCIKCGKEQQPQRHTRRRSNRSGTVAVKKGRSKPYVAYSPPDNTADGKRRYIGAFATKELAEAAIRACQSAPPEALSITVEQLHNEWTQLKSYTRLSKQMQYGYQSAWYKLRGIYDVRVKDLRTAQMQAVIDHYEGKHHQESQGGKLLYLDSTGKQTTQKTATPLIREGLSRSSLTKIKCLLTSMYDYALQCDIASKNYAEFVQLPQK